VSWLRQADGYVLLCNRDERRTRKPAAGPRLAERHGVRFVAPVDGDHGGSWIGVNQLGLWLCRWNRYGDWNAQANQSYTSRGLLLLDLLDCQHPECVLARVAGMELQNFQPFTMAVLAVGKPAMLIEWTGFECLVQHDAELQMPLTSSSTKQPDIHAVRHQHLQQTISVTGKFDRDLLWEFHRSHLPAAGPYSVCMHRDDAATASLSVVTVTRDAVQFVYHGTAPCVEVEADTVVLARSLRWAPLSESSGKVRS